MFQKRHLDSLGSRRAIDVARILFSRVGTSFSTTELALELDTSRSNIHRSMKRLAGLGLVAGAKAKRGGRFRAETGSPLSSPIWELFMAERYLALRARTRNSVELLRSAIDEGKLRCLIVFGSAAWGMEERSSDIDLCMVLADKGYEEDLRRAARDLFPEHRFEMHVYEERDIEEPRDLVVLDALLNGITVIGQGTVLRFRSELRGFPKAYLIYRLERAREVIRMMGRVEGDARAYFRETAMIILGEIDSVLETGSTRPKRLLRRGKDPASEADRLEERLSKEAERIWLR